MDPEFFFKKKKTLSVFILLLIGVGAGIAGTIVIGAPAFNMGIKTLRN